MNQGIIENLKRHYKKILLRRRLEAMDMGKELEFTLLDTLHVVRCAWEQVSESTIRNCFAKAKFSEEEYQSEPDDAELLEIWEALPAEEKMHENEVIELSDFLEDDEVTIEEETISFENAQRAWSTVRKFMQQRSEKLGVMQACDCLENEIHEIRRKNMRQLTILQSFGLS